MNTMEKLQQLVVKVSKGRLSEAVLTPEARLNEDLGLDSLAQSELIVLVEDTFAITVGLEEAAKVTTIGGILAFVEGTVVS
ncbi:acyl carrier protein [Trichlorobacter lovleyi]|uniref:acyl carrier protein n=1 Tax=Trichlorobacter lovleyi TaxID=313985 RepID=UPI0023F3EC7D|nr:acyl carrier protein [Trichlorobacter lovleyi]